MNGPEPGEPNAKAVAKAFRERFGQAPEILVRAPGRVNFLGAHVDHSEGLVLPGAIDRAVWLAAGRSGEPPRDAALHLIALDLGEEERLPLSELPPPVPQRREARAAWPDYPAGTAWVLRQEGHRLSGLRGVYGGDLPQGAGVSSSAAVEVAFLLAWNRLADLDLDRGTLAQLAQRSENDYLGLGAGLMDPFASLHGAADHLVILDCRDASFERLPVPAGNAVLIADSGVRRRLAGSGFNDRRAQVVEAAERLRRHLGAQEPGLRTLRDLSPERFAELEGRLEEPLRRRARHVVEECQRVRDGADALRRGDLKAFGELMHLSQASSRDLYEVSIPELDLLCDTAAATPGCWGARLVGGGFGGCAVILAREEAIGAVTEALEDAFQREFSRRPPVFTARLADSAEVWSEPEAKPQSQPGSADSRRRPSSVSK